MRILGAAITRSVTTVASVTALSVLLAGCSANASDETRGGASDDLKTGVGVSDDKIHLAVLTDTSGPNQQTGQGLTSGNEMWAQDVNDGGGICGRKVVLDVQDGGSQADKALALYEQQEQSQLGYLQLLGSQTLTALKPQLVDDRVLAAALPATSQNLDAAEVLMIGQTVDVETINGLSWLQKQGVIADGDKIGHIYADTDAGQNALVGSQYYAEQHAQTIIAAPVSSSETDLATAVAALKTEGVKAIVVTTPPAATSAVAVENASQGPQRAAAGQQREL